MRPHSYNDEPIYSELVFKSPFEGSLTEPLPQGNTGNPSPDMDIQIYEWDGIKNRTYRPDLSSDSDYFSSSTYRVSDNFKGKHSSEIKEIYHAATEKAQLININSEKSLDGIIMLCWMSAFFERLGDFAFYE